MVSKSRKNSGVGGGILCLVLMKSPLDRTEHFPLDLESHMGVGLACIWEEAQHSLEKFIQDIASLSNQKEAIAFLLNLKES